MPKEKSNGVEQRSYMEKKDAALAAVVAIGLISTAVYASGSFTILTPFVTAVVISCLVTYACMRLGNLFPSFLQLEHKATKKFFDIVMGILKTFAAVSIFSASMVAFVSPLSMVLPSVILAKALSETVIPYILCGLIDYFIQFSDVKEQLISSSAVARDTKTFQDNVLSQKFMLCSKTAIKFCICTTKYGVLRVVQKSLLTEIGVGMVVYLATDYLLPQGNKEHNRLRASLLGAYNSSAYYLADTSWISENLNSVIKDYSSNIIESFEYIMTSCVGLCLD